MNDLAVCYCTIKVNWELIERKCVLLQLLKMRELEK